MSEKTWEIAEKQTRELLKKKAAGLDEIKKNTVKVYLAMGYYIRENCPKCDRKAMFRMDTSPSRVADLCVDCGNIRQQERE